MDLKALKRAAKGDLPELPLTGAADARWSVISTAHDLYTLPNEDLVDLALTAAASACKRTLPELEARCGEPDATWIRTWPGEHYRLLPALVEAVAPRLVIEVGTFKGQGALALAAAGVPVLTYDIIPWQNIPDTALTDQDFGLIEQRVGDLGDPAYLATQVETLRTADLLFIDGPKDGHWENHAVPAILSVLQDRPRMVVFDDIRLMPMVQLWRDLPYAKLDITSFGHWSGTGLLRTT